MTEIKSLSGSEIEITGEISAGDFMSEKGPAIKEIAQNLDINGFRKGKIPEAENNLLSFKIKTAVMPEIKLPDYKNIARNIAREKKENINANDKLLQLLENIK